MTEQTQREPVKMYELVDVALPSRQLAPGRYVMADGRGVILSVELHRPTSSLDLSDAMQGNDLGSVTASGDWWTPAERDERAAAEEARKAGDDSPMGETGPAGARLADARMAVRSAFGDVSEALERAGGPSQWRSAARVLREMGETLRARGEKTGAPCDVERLYYSAGAIAIALSAYMDCTGYAELHADPRDNVLWAVNAVRYDLTAGGTD